VAELVNIDGAPLGERLSSDWKLHVDGQATPVYHARVSAVPFNRTWPGRQRPLDQTEEAGFAYWGMQGEVSIEITTTRPIASVTVRPISKGIAPQVEGQTISFQLAEPCQVTVEVNGPGKALHLFANPVEDDVPDCSSESVLDASVYAWQGAGAALPDPADYDTICFPPGVHEAGRIRLRSGQRVHISAGAVVYGAIEARGAKAIRITGRGILDGSLFGRIQEFGNIDSIDPFGNISLFDCENVEISGIILRDPNVWGFTSTACKGMSIENIKLVGFWRYNADGIDMVNCSDVRIGKCFVRAFDDCIALKGMEHSHGQAINPLSVRNVYVTECVLWNDWGRGLEIGAETCAPEYDNIVFRNCDIIHACHIAMDIQAGDNADIRNVLFEDIRVELDSPAIAPVYQSADDQPYQDPSDGAYCTALFVLEVTETSWTTNNIRGAVHDIVFKDIKTIGSKRPASTIRGYDKDHRVYDVTIENLQFNGEPVTDLEAARIAIGDHVGPVKIS